MCGSGGEGFERLTFREASGRVGGRGGGGLSRTRLVPCFFVVGGAPVLGWSSRSRVLRTMAAMTPAVGATSGLECPTESPTFRAQCPSPSVGYLHTLVL